MKKSLLIALALILSASLIVGVWVGIIFYKEKKKEDSYYKSIDTIEGVYYFSEITNNDSYKNEFNYNFYGFSIEVDKSKLEATLSNPNGEKHVFSLVKQNRKFFLSAKETKDETLFGTKPDYLEFSSDTIQMNLIKNNKYITAKFIKDKSRIKQYDYKFSTQSSTSSILELLPSFNFSFINIYEGNVTLYLKDNYYICSMTKENTIYKLTYISSDPSKNTSGYFTSVLSNSYLVILEDKLQILYEKNNDKFTISYEKIVN